MYIQTQPSTISFITILDSETEAGELESSSRWVNVRNSREHEHLFLSPQILYVEKVQSHRKVGRLVQWMPIHHPGGNYAIFLLSSLSFSLSSTASKQVA